MENTATIRSIKLASKILALCSIAFYFFTIARVSFS